MFKTQVGPVSEENAYAYLRPETAQGIFVNFNNVLTTTARKLPFGIAQVGKGFRNEINPATSCSASANSTCWKIEFFVHPGTEDEWQDKWLEDRLSWWEHIGVSRSAIRIHDVPREDLAHYSKKTYDLMYGFPTLGFEELEGIASRTDFDLGSHTRYQEQYDLTAKVADNQSSTTRLSYFDPRTNRHVIPFVVEPSAGVGRCLLAVLSEAYDEPMVKAPPEEKLAAVKDGLDAFKRVGFKEQQTAGRGAGVHAFLRGVISGELPESMPRIDALLAMPGADRIREGKTLRNLSQKVIGDHLPDRVAAQAPPGTGQSGGVSPQANRRPASGHGQGHSQIAAIGRQDTHGLRRHGRHRQALPAPGRNRHTALRHGRLSNDRRSNGDGPRPGHHGTGPGAHERNSRIT